MSEVLPRLIRRVVVPPIKCQGIKTKLVPFILANIRWDGKGRWIEPFLGSGVVAFNVNPKRARLNDINPHIIELYRGIYEGRITPSLVGAYLTSEGEKLLRFGESHYYHVRERFNRSGDPLDFLFLSRACFNGLMRFNAKGEFNVPFCRKPDRFRRAYITKIVNQVRKIANLMRGKEWEFTIGDWKTCLEDVAPDDFVYLDPPYIGRHTDYYQCWDESEAETLAKVAHSLPCGVALSMWKQNRYRTNLYLSQFWGDYILRTFNHFYHVGSSEDLRHPMEEALLIKPGYAVEKGCPPLELSEKQLQLALPIASR